MIENPNSNSAQRASLGAELDPKTSRKIPKSKTALGIALKDHEIQWLGEYVTEQYTSYYAALGGWRKKMGRFERLSENDHSDRLGKAPDREESNKVRTIFDRSNRSLGTCSGFADFAFAQARNDIFGTSPYFAAVPQGISDEKLGRDITRHAHWKFGQTGMKDCMIDALKLACDLGTAFPKITWKREVEKYEQIKVVALNSEGTPITQEETGEYIYAENAAMIAELGDEIQGWEEMLIEESMPVYNNIQAHCIDYEDIAFDPTAPEMNLLYTDVYHRFEMGLLDAKRVYNLTDEQYNQARDLIHNQGTGISKPRDHRDETKPNNGHADEENANPTIRLVEGYLRVNPKGVDGDPIRIWCVFSPDLTTILSLDYLANRTPGAKLPIFSVPWYKVPNRICGKGYFERFEDVENFIDEQYNLVIHKDRNASTPMGGYDVEGLAEEIEEDDVHVDPDKLWALKSGKKIEDVFSFMKMPDASSRTIDILQMMLQMAQMRTGITSASQGELSGVPQGNTATGVNQLISRGATLLKWPIDTVKDSITKPYEYAVHLLYANQDALETFTWSEGRSPEIIQIDPQNVHNMVMDVRMTMTQAQQQTQLQSAQGAINFIQSYMGMPEHEKIAVRSVFIQALQSLGFNNADEIVRESVTDMESLLAILPPEIQEPFYVFAVENGLITPPEQPEGEGPPAEPQAAPAATEAPAEPQPAEQ